MFSQRCPKCDQISVATFCGEETCRRKFLLRPGRSREFCPIHDPAQGEARDSEARRPGKLQEAIDCPRCGANLFGVKPEDFRQVVGSEVDD